MAAPERPSARQEGPNPPASPDRKKFSLLHPSTWRRRGERPERPNPLLEQLNAHIARAEAEQRAQVAHDEAMRDIIRGGN